MKKKLWLFVIFVLLFQVVSMPFSYVEAGGKEQPKVCNGPSEMMSHYFAFQGKMLNVLQGSELNSERFSAEFGPGGLFTNRVLDLHAMSSIELLSSSVVANLRSFVSNSATTMVLFLAASLSVVVSNTEGFAILFADWPIVRDYKKMLDIETDLFDVAYFRSKEIDLLHDIDVSSAEKIRGIVKEYQDLGLLTGNDAPINGSMKDILLDLIGMNAVMKEFISVGGKNIEETGLYKYKGRFGRFDENAIRKLSEDYKDVRGPFGGCNAYGNNIKGMLKKVGKNNSDSVSGAIQDVKDSLVRLKNVLFGGKRWNFRDPCEDLNGYEMAQLQDYWGGNRKCGEGINPFTAKSYINDKIAHSKQKKNKSNTLKKSKNPAKNSDLNTEIKKSWNSSEREQRYREMVGVGMFSKYFDFELSDGFARVFEDTEKEYSQAQENAVSTDYESFQLIRLLLDQVDEVNESAGELNNILNKIQGKQCSS